ncbi:4Fe-4S cluster-binding domain-containing protein [Peribacillus tepidiphilus]|uniref:4Fe-4S cluster-binding domain-containing protein n=1 Tax=Peribacillus tepidiphilus TaxID=2652445 RepID=UPI00129225E6|nr:4Fe-4S cluster-binding domain-containing protein [Peribacillus tepidiphilus]
MNYLIIDNSCEVVLGENGALIYDLKNKRFFSLDVMHAEIINMLKKGNAIKVVKNKFDEEIVDTFIKNLMENQLAKLSSSYFVEESFRVGKARPSTDLNFNTCYIQLPTTCYKDCNDCFDYKLSSCLTCSKPKAQASKFDMIFYKGLISDILKTPVNTIIFHGGDPLTNESEFLDILKFTRENAMYDIRIIFITNGSLLKHYHIDTFVSNKISPLIVFHHTDENMDMENLKTKAMELSNLFTPLVENNVEYYANIVFENQPLNTQRQLIQILEEYNFGNVTTSKIVNMNNDVHKYASLNFPEKMAYNFGYYKDLHPCLNGIIAVTSDKKIVPCPSMHKRILLDLEDKKFIDLFNHTEEIDKFWRFTLSKTDKCKSCKYRYACIDCRFIEEEITKSINEKEICYLNS